MGELLRFPRARVIRPILSPPETRSCACLVIGASRGDVTMHADATCVAMAPDQARALAKGLLELADEAEANPKVRWKGSVTE